MGDRWGHAPQMRHDSGNLRRLEQIPAKWHFAEIAQILDAIRIAFYALDILPRLRQFGLADIERHFLNFNRLHDRCAFGDAH